MAEQCSSSFRSFQGTEVDKVIRPEQFALHVHWAFPRYPHMARFVPLRRGLPTFLFNPPFHCLSHGPGSTPNDSQVPGYMILRVITCLAGYRGSWDHQSPATAIGFDEVKILWIWFSTLAPKLESAGNPSSVLALCGDHTSHRLFLQHQILCLPLARVFFLFFI